MNKKLFGTFLFVLILFSAVAQERKFNFYPNVAVDLGGAIPFPLSDIPDGAGGTPEPYPSVGIGAKYKLIENWQLAVELNYHLIAFSATADVISQSFNEGVILNCCEIQRRISACSCLRIIVAGDFYLFITNPDLVVLFQRNTNGFRKG